MHLFCAYLAFNPGKGIYLIVLLVTLLDDSISAYSLNSEMYNAGQASVNVTYSWSG